MPGQYDTMMSPEVEGLMDRAGSKFSLCTLASTRAREINAYFNTLGQGVGSMVPPQVTSVARKSLSIAFEEIAADKIVPVIPEKVVEPDGVGVEPRVGDATSAGEVTLPQRLLHAGQQRQVGDAAGSGQWPVQQRLDHVLDGAAMAQRRQHDGVGEAALARLQPGQMAVQRLIQRHPAIQHAGQDVDGGPAGGGGGAGSGSAAHPQGFRLSVTGTAPPGRGPVVGDCPAVAGAVPPRGAIARRRCTRLAVDGWVEKRLSMDRACSGLTMNRWAVAGFCSARP